MGVQTLPKELCGISFFYVVKAERPYNAERDYNRHESVKDMLGLDGLSPEIDTSWKGNYLTIQITVRPNVLEPVDLDELNQRIKNYMLHFGYQFTD